MLWKNKKNNLDEMQEQRLLHIEKNCFWLLDILLFVVILVQLLMGKEKSELTGELLCFFVANLTLVLSCIRYGIWDRRLKPDLKSNLKVSAVAAFFVAVMNLLCWIAGRYEHRSPAGLVAVLLIPSVLAYAITLAIMSICSVITTKRANSLEAEQEDSEDD